MRKLDGSFWRHCHPSHGLAKIHTDVAVAVASNSKVKLALIMAAIAALWILASCAEFHRLFQGLKFFSSPNDGHTPLNVSARSSIVIMALGFLRVNRTSSKPIRPGLSHHSAPAWRLSHVRIAKIPRKYCARELWITTSQPALSASVMKA